MNILNQILKIETAKAQLTSVANTAADVGNATTNQVSNTFGFILGQIPLWITAALILVLTFFLARFAKAKVEEKMINKGIDQTNQEVQIVIGRITNIIVIVLGFTIALSIFGIDMAPIVAAGAFGIGFASQDLIMNFLSGIMVLTAKHFSIGDVVSVNGVTGRIMDIQMRATIIKAFDGTKVVVPNAELLKNKVVNKHGYPVRKISVIMGAGYDDDLDEVVRVTLETVKTIEGVLAKPAPKVIFYEWEDFEVLFKVHVWVESKGGKLMKVKNEVIKRLTEAYNVADFDMPYPIQTTELTSLYSPPVQIDVNKVDARQKPSVFRYPSKFNRQMRMQELDKLNNMSNQISESISTAADAAEAAEAADAVEVVESAELKSVPTVSSPSTSQTPNWLQSALDQQTPTNKAESTNNIEQINSQAPIQMPAPASNSQSNDQSNSAQN